MWWLSCCPTPPCGVFVTLVAFAGERLSRWRFLSIEYGTMRAVVREAHSGVVRRGIAALTTRGASGQNQGLCGSRVRGTLQARVRLATRCTRDDVCSIRFRGDHWSAGSACTVGRRRHVGVPRHSRSLVDTGRRRGMLAAKRTVRLASVAGAALQTRKGRRRVLHRRICKDAVHRADPVRDGTGATHDVLAGRRARRAACPSATSSTGPPATAATTWS